MAPEAESQRGRAIHPIWHSQAVPMNATRLRQAVLEVNIEPLTAAVAQDGSRHASAVAPSVEWHASASGRQHFSAHVCDEMAPSSCSMTEAWDAGSKGGSTGTG
ncbi:MAG: hypothetical protein AcusKO_42600 [Acuticoccus sp.]